MTTPSRKRLAFRMYRRIYQRMAGRDYNPYGIDWPTMRLLHPVQAAILRQCMLILNEA